MVRPVTRTNKYFTNDEETLELKQMFDKWMGELPNAREITFKPNMDNFTVFVVYEEIIAGDGWDGY